MFRLITLLILIITSCFILSWLLTKDGLVTIEWLGYYIEISVIFTIFILLFIALILSAVINLFATLKNLPKKLSERYQEQKLRSGLIALTKGFEAIASDDLKKARRLTNMAAASGDKIDLIQPPLLLLEYQLAEIEGNKEVLEKYLYKMLEHKEIEPIALKGLATLNIERGQYNEALTFAERFKRIKGEAEWLIRLLPEIHKKLGNFEEAINIMEKYSKTFIDKHVLAELYYLLAKDLASKQNIDSAIKKLKKACTLNPDLIQAKALLADLQVR